jgi:hypothetical protein
MSSKMLFCSLNKFVCPSLNKQLWEVGLCFALLAAGELSTLHNCREVQLVFWGAAKLWYLAPILWLTAGLRIAVWG